MGNKESKKNENQSNLLNIFIYETNRENLEHIINHTDIYRAAVSLNLWT